MAPRFAIAALTLAAALGTRAHAIDLTGTWEVVKQDYPCKSYSSEGVEKDEGSGVALLIAQTDGNLAISFFSDPWRGFVIEDARGVGRGLAHECRSPAVSVGTLDIVSASTFPVDSHGISGLMTVKYQTVDQFSYYVCKRFKLHRIDTAAPNPPPCP